MKRCPQCNRVEADDSLAFCRADGTPLINDSSRVAGEIGTARLGSKSSSEIDTSILPHTTVTDVTRSTASISPDPSYARPVASTKSTKWKALVAVGALLAICIVVGAYFYTKGKPNRSIESVAVLPFENKSGNADSEYLSDGLAESLMYKLSQLPNLKVSPTSSVMRYKGKDIDPQTIATELAVDAVMSGRLAQRGDNLTISVELIDARTNKLLWGEQFERKMSELVATQSEIASAISEKLQLKLSGDDSSRVAKRITNDNEAYQLYLQGRYFWNKRSADNLRKAIDLLKAATQKDPNFALAYAGLADCYVVSYYYAGERTRELMPLGKSYAAKAIELDPTLAEPHTTLAFATWLLDWDKTAAEREFHRAIELNPNYPTGHHWYSRYLRGLGRMDEAFREIKRAEELDPLSLVIINNIAEMYIDRNDLNSATRECQRMTDLDPNFWAAHQTLGIVLTKQGRFDEALAEAQKSVELNKRGNASLALLGHVYGKLKRRSDVDAVIKELEKRYTNKAADGRDLAVVYAGLDDKDQAFAWLEKAFADHSFFMVFLRLEPLMDSLESDSRWNQLLRRVGTM